MKTNLTVPRGRFAGRDSHSSWPVKGPANWPRAHSQVPLSSLLAPGVYSIRAPQFMVLPFYRQTKKSDCAPLVRVEC